MKYSRYLCGWRGREKKRWGRVSHTTLTVDYPVLPCIGLQHNLLRFRFIPSTSVHGIQSTSPPSKPPACTICPAHLTSTRVTPSVHSIRFDSHRSCLLIEVLVYPHYIRLCDGWKGSTYPPQYQSSKQSKSRHNPDLCFNAAVKVLEDKATTARCVFDAFITTVINSDTASFDNKMAMVKKGCETRDWMRGKQ